MVAVVSFTIVLSFFAATSTFAQDRPHTEEYMQQHDGGDRVECLQEVEHSDSSFYVPPSNDASLQNSD